MISICTVILLCCIEKEDIAVCKSTVLTTEKTYHALCLPSKEIRLNRCLFLEIMCKNTHNFCTRKRPSGLALLIFMYRSCLALNTLFIVKLLLGICTLLFSPQRNLSLYKYTHCIRLCEDI